MSRIIPPLRAIVASSSRSSRQYATSRPSSSVSGNTTSIDARILEGMPEFLPKSNMDNLCEWQSGLWTRLQAEVQNNPALFDVKQKWDRSGLDMTHLVSFAARETDLTMAFNYASCLLNNSFFLESLNGDTPQRIPAIYESLGDKVEAYAEGIVGGGWLWLVRAGSNHADLDIIPTFSSGTLLITNRSQRGREDLPIFATPSDSGNPPPPASAGNGENEDGPEAESGPVLPPQNTSTPNQPQPRLRSSTNSSGFPAPLAVLNLFEHAYIGEKYGVWGRREYARDWWRSLDWAKVQRRASQIV